MRSMVGMMVFVLMSAAAPAVAQYGGSPVSAELEGAFRFQLELPMFRYLSMTQSSDTAGASDNTTNVVSLGGPSAMTTLLGSVGLGIGYAVADSVVIGSGFQLSYDSLSDPDVDIPADTFLSLGFEPYVEYLGGDGSTKPFVGATLYVRRQSRTNTNSFDGTQDTTSRTFVGGGLIGGTHFFVGEGCSIDLAGKLTYGVQAGGEPALPDGVSVSLLDFLLTISISAWIL